MLALKVVVLDAELYSASNGDTFQGVIGQKRRVFAKILGLDEYILLIFTSRLALALKVVVLDAELYSASNGDTFRGGGLSQNTGF